MTDQELDRLLAAAVGVDHSPEFLLRVQRRVEAEEPAPAVTARWRLGALGAGLTAASVLAATILWPKPAIVTPVREPARASMAASTSTPITLPVRAAEPKPAVARRMARQPRPASAPRAAEVLISPDEKRGLELVIRAARTGRLPAELLVADRSTRVLRPIEISPMNIEPLPEIAPLQGDRQ